MQMNPKHIYELLRGKTVQLEQQIQISSETMWNKKMKLFVLVAGSNICSVFGIIATKAIKLLSFMP